MSIIRSKDKNRIFGFMLALFLALSILPGKNVYAQESEPEIVRIGYYEDGVFESGGAEGESKDGYAYEYYRKLSEFAGWQCEYVYLGWDDAYNALLDGDVDFLAGLAWREDRTELMLYPDKPMGNETYAIFKNTADGSITSDKESLNGKSIGVLYGNMETVLNKWLSDNGVDAKTMVFANIEERNEALKNNTVDACLGESASLGADLNLEAVQLLDGVDYYIVVAKDRTDLLKELNAAQEAMFEQEPYYIEKLQDKFYNNRAYNKSLTADEAAWVEQHDCIRVGYYKDYMPLSDIDADGNVAGLLKDIFPAMLSGLYHTENIKIEYYGYDGYQEILDALQGNEIDVMFPASTGAGVGEECGIYQTSEIWNGSVNLIYKGELSEATTATIALVEANTLMLYYGVHSYPDAQIVYYDSTEACLDAVSRGQVGSTISISLRTNPLISNEGYADLHTVDISEAFGVCFAVKEGNVTLLKLLNHAVNTLESAHTNDLLQKNVQSMYKASTMGFVRDHIGIVLLLALLIIVLISAVVVVLSVSMKRLRAQERMLKEALRKAEEAGKAKSNFLFNMSHDIRTPMNAIVGFTNLLERSDADPEKRSEYIRKIQVSNNYLLSLINNVLEMSRIESGKAVLDENVWGITQLFDSIYSLLQGEADRKGLTFVRSCSVNHEFVLCDQTKLREIYLNIISNAVKYTPAGGSVTFTIEEMPGTADGFATYKTVVSDTGIGMSEEFLPTLFDEFSRERNTTESKVQGTGLGLAITKRLVELMGGTIEVQSKPGVGSTFTVILSFRLATEEEIRNVREKSREYVKSSFIGKKVLLAEDNDLNAEIAMEILEEAGLEVDRAEDGDVCVRMLSEAAANTYDAVLMDIQMPRMNGYEATRQIRNLADRDKAGVPILAMTANAFEEDIRNALEAGMNGHTAKPIDIPKLMEALSAVLS
ncbi:MAG: transporter substrate-binding domain-containing protein [Eubacteriales bacterium]|nr:transporter substrate-binding domain-containing protein [Eubacteriales bacterium]